jgi:hypothetical protein
MTWRRAGSLVLALVVGVPASAAAGQPSVAYDDYY